MKRVITAALLLLFLSAAGAFTLWDLHGVEQTVLQQMEQIAQSVQAKQTDLAFQQTQAAAQYWEKSEKRLLRYLRHDKVDAVTERFSRLDALLKTEEYTLLLAETDQIKSQITHIWESELPIFRNLF